MINENEQWNLSGDCNKCRRQKYCNTHCKAHKLTGADEDEARSVIMRAFSKTRAGRAMNMIMQAVNEANEKKVKG